MSGKELGEKIANALVILLTSCFGALLIGVTVKALIWLLF